MKRTSLPSFLLSLFGLAGFATSQAQFSTARSVLASERFEVTAGAMYSFGEGHWTERGGDDFFGGYRSQLDYEDLDSTMFLIGLSGRVSDRWRVDGHLGLGDIDDGTGRDRDWLFGGFRSGEEFVSESRNEESGDITSIDANVYYRFSGSDPASQFEAFLGLDYYVDDLQARNGVQTFLNGDVVNDPFAGLASTYEFEWLSVKIGLAGEHALTPNWSIRGKAAVAPFIDYNGEAFWNLRTDFKRTPPNFVHEANSGLGLEFKLSTRYAWESLFGEVGYWYRSWDVDDGVSETFFNDGTSAFAGLEAEAERHGVFGQIGLRF